MQVRPPWNCGLVQSGVTTRAAHLSICFLGPELYKHREVLSFSQVPFIYSQMKCPPESLVRLEGARQLGDLCHISAPAESGGYLLDTIQTTESSQRADNLMRGRKENVCWKKKNVSIPKSVTAHLSFHVQCFADSCGFLALFDNSDFCDLSAVSSFICLFACLNYESFSERVCFLSDTGVWDVSIENLFLSVLRWCYAIRFGSVR